VNNSMPTAVLPPAQQATAIAAGDDFTCAIVAGGMVYCWGANDLGQLGMPMNKPIAQGAVGLAAGAHHACAVLKDGSVQCWGSNSAQQLGVAATATSTCTDGGVSTSCSATPVKVGL
jgi:alpha-tubulin suppressor-like RCC1 family protein